jgi:hypothetical protein
MDTAGIARTDMGGTATADMPMLTRITPAPTHTTQREGITLSLITAAFTTGTTPGITQRGRTTTQITGTVGRTTTVGATVMAGVGEGTAGTGTEAE